ncbi:hypothetical protein KY332_03920 [Candidatus Woesearchaeota archaeon]|nr:hypothetical protein [Candidatus Woesearchaeota archaeon]
MFRKILLILITLILAANISYALDIDTYNADFNIFKNKVVVDTSIEFQTKVTGIYEFSLPKDYNALSVYVDGKQTPFDLEANNLKITLRGNSKISFNYVTEEFIDKTNFLLNMKFDYNINNLKIKLILPEGAALKKPIQEADITSGSIYPNPTQATTDGRSLIFIWEKTDVKQGDDMSIFAQIQPKTNYLPWIFSIIAVILITAGLILILAKKKTPPQPEIKEKIIVKHEDLVEKHLKPDEEQIINVLKLKEGSCEQGTLRIATGFSKATLSRLLKELEDRKVIKKEKRGKKNLVFLRK